MEHSKIKRFIFLFGFLLSIVLGSASNIISYDGHSNIDIKVAHTQGSPRTSSIVATIDGHWLSIVFLENLGQVNIQVSRVNGGDSQIQSSPTPNGMDFYIQSTGDYVVYFTLPNNDVYYGEFEVTD
jgi:hypothetical protein